MRNNSVYRIASVLLIFIFISGCAKKEWGTLLQDNVDQTSRQLITEEQQSRASCGCCIDAELTAKWQSQLYNGGIEGYLQIMMPSSVKLVAINPMGQPLFAFTTNGKTFQSINAVKGIYKHGKVLSFVERHSLPKNVFHDSWGTWITGAMNFTEEELTELRQDKNSRGIWLKVEKQGKNRFPEEYLLFDPSKKQLLERVAYNKDGNETARVKYQKWTKVNGCPLPTSIEVQGTSYGVDIFIDLKDIITDYSFTPDNFFLKLPPGYLQQYYP